MRRKRYKKGEIATLLTMAALVGGLVLTFVTSYFSNTKKNLASRPRAMSNDNSPSTSSSPSTSPSTSSSPSTSASTSSTPKPAPSVCPEGKYGTGCRYGPRPSKPEEYDVSFPLNSRKHTFDGYGFDLEECNNNPLLPFACYVVDTYTCADGEDKVRFRWYGCTGQPCKNTKIRQSPNRGPGVLVGKGNFSNIQEGQCILPETPTQTPRSGANEDETYETYDCMIKGICEAEIESKCGARDAGKCVRANCPPKEFKIKCYSSNSSREQGSNGLTLPLTSGTNEDETDSFQEGGSLQPENQSQPLTSKGKKMGERCGGELGECEEGLKCSLVQGGSGDSRYGICIKEIDLNIVNNLKTNIFLKRVYTSHFLFLEYSQNNNIIEDFIINPGGNKSFKYTCYKSDSLNIIYEIYGNNENSFFHSQYFDCNKDEVIFKITEPV